MQTQDQSTSSPPGGYAEVDSSCWFVMDCLNRGEGMGACGVARSRQRGTGTEPQASTEPYLGGRTQDDRKGRGRYRIEPTRSSRFVFQSVSSKHGHISDIRDSIKQVSASSGVEFTEHDLRRTFETTAERLDISYYTLKRLLNHKTGSDPTAGYIITSAERMRDASQKVADSLASSMGMPAPKPKAESKLRRIQ